MRRQFVLRSRILAGAVIVLALVLIGRLYQLQIVEGAAYRNEANSQYVRTTQDLFDRGSIYFTERTGEKVAAASVKSGYLIAIDPRKIGDPELLYDKLNALVPLDRASFFAHASKPDDPYEEIAHRVESGTADTIRALGLPGVQLYREQWRYYPGNTLAAHVLGFVGYSDETNGLAGRTGLERYWQSVLARTSAQLSVNFFAELFGNVRNPVAEKSAAREGDIVTTIDPAVQQALETELQKTEDQWHAETIGGVIINPQNGDVYALGSLPTYDPNDYANVTDASVFRDPIVESVYEMGSIVKPLAMAIGLDTGAVTPETTYDDTGRVKIDGYTISNYDGVARGVIPMQQILSQSLNVGMAWVERQIGNKVFGERMRAYGLGEETGIDLPSEAHGLVENLSSPRDVEYATAAFGQGIALTPIETARALCSLGNGGYLVTPHLVKTIDYEDGESSNVAPDDDRTQVLSEKTSETITRMLVTVVDQALMHGTVKKDHYAIAAKTGTAQIAEPNARGYYPDRYLHSFFGYFPAYEPKYLIFLYHVHPKGAPYASETLTVPFMDLVDFLINYYDVPPDR